MLWRLVILIVRPRLGRREPRQRVEDVAGGFKGISVFFIVLDLMSMFSTEKSYVQSGLRNKFFRSFSSFRCAFCRNSNFLSLPKIPIYEKNLNLTQGEQSYQTNSKDYFLENSILPFFRTGPGDD